MTKIKKQCAWPKGDFSFENTLSSRKHSGAKFPIFIKISSIRKQNPFNFNILAHLIFTPCCSNRVLAKGNIKSKVATHDPKHMFQNMEQESSTSCHFIASYSWVLLLTLLSYAGLEAEGCSGKTDLRDFLCTWHQWHSRYTRAFSDINKKGFMSVLHVKVWVTNLCMFYLDLILVSPSSEPKLQEQQDPCTCSCLYLSCAVCPSKGRSLTPAIAVWLSESALVSIFKSQNYAQIYPAK